MAPHTVADLDRRLGQIDAAIEEAVKRGKTNTACRPWKASAGPVRVSPVSETRPPLPPLAALKAERATVAAKGRQIETEAAPIRYVAELVGADTNSEHAHGAML